METQVAIIGAGPVGLTLAMDLAQRGVDVAVVESRAEHEPADAKCNTVAARTMEIFRRLGVAEEVRASGLGDDFSTDVIFCTAISGEEITRIRLPSRNERFGIDGRSAPGFIDSDWLTPEPVVRISQLYLNPILYRHAHRFEGVTLLPETTFVRYDDSVGGVTVHCETNDGEPLEIRARYLVGCDGASSRVRKQMGVRLLGDAEISKSRSSLIRCPAVKELFRGEPAWMSWVINPRQAGTVVAIDGDELWLVHRTLSVERDFESVDRDQSMRQVLGVDDDFTWEVVGHQDWTARRMIASRFRDGNVFICGDAAHIWIPFAGYGMNAGIADATNLSWMMAAVLNAQANERLLEAHEKERHPITEQVSRLAMGKALEYMSKSQRRKVPKVLESRSFLGKMARSRLGPQLYAINWPQFSCEGLNFGYYYDDSPIIHYDGEAPPTYDMGSATPSTVPGCRVPHFWLDDGTSLYDHLGPGYTLLDFGGDQDCGELTRAFGALGIPFLRIEVPRTPELFDHTFVLARTDQHVAWRGDRLPGDVDRFVGHLAALAKPGQDS